MIYRSYRLAVAAAILGIAIPLLLEFLASGQGCSDYCGIFVRPGYSFTIISFILLCVTLYVSRKKIRLGGSKILAIPEYIALVIVAVAFEEAAFELTQFLIDTFSRAIAGNFLFGLYNYSVFWRGLIIGIGLWTIGAYLLVWRGTLAEDAGRTNRRPLKGLLVSVLFILFIGSSVFGSFFYLNSFLKNGLANKCKADFIELQKEHASTICTIDSDCSIDELIDELDAREREQIKKSQDGKDFIGFTSAQFKFSDLEFHCNNFRLRCQAGKCVPNK